MVASGPVARFGPWRRELRAFLELLALAGVAVAQPTFDLLTKNTGVFVALRTSRLETIALAILVVLVPPIVLWGVEVAIGLVLPRTRRYVHAVIGAGVIAVIAVEVLKKQTELTSSRLVALAIPLGLIGGVLILRFQIVRLWLRYLAFAPAIFAVIFLFASPVTAVVFEKGNPSAKHIAIGKPTRVVMIVMDEFPTESLLDGTGHIDAALYPNFAALAATSTWFRNDTTVAPYTEEAVPAILTGDYPAGAFKPPVASEYPHNLFTLLGGTYGMNVHESITHLCPSGICSQTGSLNTGSNGFRSLVDTTSSLWREFASPKRTTTALNTGTVELDPDPLDTGAKFIRSLQPATGPQLDFLHILLPHQPWHLRVTGQDDGRFKAPLGMYQELDWNDAWTAMSGRQRHLLQVQAADRLLGQVIARLKHIGAYQDSLIVVTADHGVAFTAGHAIRGVANENYPQILWTPMFVRTPDQGTGTVDDHPVRSIDVLPTIADVLDAKIPWKVDGSSMFGPAPARGEPRVFNWSLNEVKPPPGSDYISFPGGPGFAAAIGARASDATGAVDLRLYRIGPFGDLIGRPAAPLVSPGARGPAGTLDHRAVFDDVHPGAAAIPWTFVRGKLDVAKNGDPLVITVNGVIAGVSETSLANPAATRADFWSTLPPQLFRTGRNAVAVYEVTGTPAAPHLAEVRLG